MRSIVAARIRMTANDIVSTPRFSSKASAWPPSRSLYLIDGSSQMYRAYHAPVRTADGGAAAQRAGPADQRRLHLRHDAAQAAQRAQAASTSPRRSICPGRTFRDDLAADYKANRAPMPDELAAADPDGARAPARRSACRSSPHERYEADDVIGTLAEQAAAGGLRRRDRHRRQGLLSARRATASASSTRATKAPGTTPTGVKEKFGVAPEQVVDVLALMGDTIDNIKGVPGIGEKGARELIATYGSLDDLLAHAAEVTEQALSRRRCSRTPTRRGRAASCARIRTDVPVEFDSDALRYRGASRERCFEIFTELGFRSLVDGVRADRRHRSPRTTASSTRAEELARAGRSSCGAAGRFALRVLPDQPAAMRAGDRRPARSRPAPRDADYVPIGASRRSATTGARAAASTIGARRARAAGARGSRRSRRSATI